jgi:hypothetical protein
MLKILGIVFAIIVVGIAGVLAFAATKPDTFRVQRAASIKAPPEKIFRAPGPAPVVRRLGSNVDCNAMAVRGWKRSAALSVCDGER